MKKVLNWITYGITALLVVLIVFLLVTKIKGEPAFIGGYTAMWVQTESMEEEIPKHSYILVRASDGTDVKVDDVIVFYSDDPALLGNLNTHRVVEIGEDGKTFITKGDHNYVKDEYPASAEKVVGKYVRVLPVLSFIGRALTTKTGIIVVALITLAVLALVFVPDFLKMAKLEKKEKEKAKKEAMDALVRAEVERLKQQDAQQKNTEQQNAQQQDVDQQNTQNND